MQRSTALFLFLSLAIGFLLFQVKYEVVEIEEKLTQTLTQIKREKENIHILKAEWSHLNEPQRLQKLAEKFLDVMPIKVEQIASLDYGLGGEPVNNFQSHTRLAAFKGE
jgi:hypothetical protein